MRNKGFTTAFIVAFISALLLLVSLPQNTVGEEYLSEWTNHEGVRENSTAYATSAGGPSLEFYMDNGFVEQPVETLSTGTGELQIDAYILMGSEKNNLNFFWDTSLGHTITITIKGNSTVEINSVSYNITHSFATNNWVQVRITKESTSKDTCNVTVIVGANTFKQTIESSFAGGIKIDANIYLLGTSVFVDNIQIQYTPNLREVATGWYNTIIDMILSSEYFSIISMYFSVILIVVAGLIGLIVVRRVFT